MTATQPAKPVAAGFRMPAEWTPHERTWMAWPSPNPTFTDERELAAAREAWGAVARAVRAYEPVTLVVSPGDAESARAVVGEDVDLVERELDDAWMRDIGPTFVTNDAGELAAVDWTFNGWGARNGPLGPRLEDRPAGVRAGRHPHLQHPAGQRGRRHPRRRRGHRPAHRHRAAGQGPQPRLDPRAGRGGDPRAPRHHQGHLAAVRPRRRLRHLRHPGHVDIVAAFARPGVVLVHTQPDPSHPDHERCKTIAAILRASTDARGRQLEVVEVPAPTVLEEDGEWVDYSYINHYLCNGGVVLCAFDDPRDEEAAEIFRGLFPERTVTLVDARTIFAGGGGIHCITQQQPKV